MMKDDCNAGIECWKHCKKQTNMSQRWIYAKVVGEKD